MSRLWDGAVRDLGEENRAAADRGPPLCGPRAQRSGIWCGVQSGEPLRRVFRKIKGSVADTWLHVVFPFGSASVDRETIELRQDFWCRLDA